MHAMVSSQIPTPLNLQVNRFRSRVESAEAIIRAKYPDIPMEQIRRSANRLAQSSPHFDVLHYLEAWASDSQGGREFD